MTTFLILFGLSLFILRSQLLRVALKETGASAAGQIEADKLHASPALGAMSGWFSLGGAAGLMLLALITSGYLWGLGLIVFGIMGGVALSSFTLPTIGSTLALGHQGGDGNRSIAEFNRRYGAHIAFGVAVLALLAWALHLGLL
ncbi:MAG: hypothetical protein MUC44_11310 [Beijerinckiaceae bacterium]|jgi:hypothetical protein|nr:hypothetical protein [Beijerinckiaceae bacterium]